jgi:GNAT superfamily N-acetyltransferase
MRAVEFITESKTVEYEGLTLKISKNGHQLMVNALDDWGNKVLGQVRFNIGDGKELDPQDLAVDDKYQGQGIAKVMYDYVKSLGYTIVRSYDQTDAGKGFWNKHRGEDVRVWEQGVAEGIEQKPVIIYTNNRGATIDDGIKKSLPVTELPANKLQMWEKHKSMKDPKIANWVTNKLLPELKQNGVLKPLLVWNNDGEFFVIDGNHRFIAYQVAGYQGRVPVQIVPDNMVNISDTLPGQQGVAEDISRRGFLKGAGAMAAGISAAGGARADNQTDPNKLIAIVNINGESKEFNLTGRFKGDVKSQLHQAEKFITEFLEKRNINFSNLELRYQRAVLKTQNIGSVKEEQGMAENFADGKNPGRKGLSKRVGIPKKATLGKLEKIAQSSTGERRRMAQWQLNMRRGKKK